MEINILIIILSLLFCFFISGMEIAFVSSNRLRIELDKKKGRLSSKIIAIFTKNQNQYIATMLIGNSIGLIFCCIFFTDFLYSYICLVIKQEIVIFLVIILIISLLILFFIELLPKTIFNINPNSMLNFFALPVFVIYLILYPLSKLTIWFSHFVMRKIFKIKPDKNQNINIFAKLDFESLVYENQKNNQSEYEIENEIKIFQNALAFSKVKLRECIVPRNEIVAVEISSPIGELHQKFLETGFSKILIYKESIDNIIGYVHLLELFKFPQSIESILSELLIVPETMSANKLLDLLITKRKSIALVVDEFGGTAGIATIEDIMEEIFGEIEDEHDSKEYEDLQISENEYLFSGRVEIDFINEKYNLDIPVSEDYETIAGFILFHHQTIPNEKDEIDIDVYRFIIEKVEKPRIEKVRIILNI